MLTAWGALQEAQALRRQVAVRDKEAAERATLVTQEKLQRYSNRQPHRLQDVWIQPPLSAKRKVPGNLDAHYNGFRCALPVFLSRVYRVSLSGAGAEVVGEGVNHQRDNPPQKKLHPHSLECCMRTHIAHTRR